MTPPKTHQGLQGSGALAVLSASRGLPIELLEQQGLQPPQPGLEYTHHAREPTQSGVSVHNDISMNHL